MNETLELEAEPFEIESTVEEFGQEETGGDFEFLGESEGETFDEFEVLASEVPKTPALTNRGTGERTMPQTACASYEKGEVQKSLTPQGHLASDVITHKDGLLIADFPVNWRTPRPSLKREKALQKWLADIAQGIRDLPTTTIQILGFSDCVGELRYNKLLRDGRAIRVRDLLQQMVGSGPQWNIIKSKITNTGRAPDGTYVSSNATVEGRAQNRSVLIKIHSIVDVESDTPLTACIVRPAQVAAFPMLGLIPNVPAYTGKLPIDYKLDAKKLIGEFATDISSRGHKAFVITALADTGLTAAEIFTAFSATGTLAGVLTVLAPLTALAGVFLALGSGCLEAAEAVAAKSSKRGFSHGVVIGAHGRRAQWLKDIYGNQSFAPNPVCGRQVQNVEIANYRAGLGVGYAHGLKLCPNQRAIFWRDLRSRMGNAYKSYKAPSKVVWPDWYRAAANAFWKAHLL